MSPFTTERITIYTDGGSRGNPGPAAAAFVLLDEDNNQLQGRGLFLGKATNNVAEYTAVIESLKASKKINARKVTLFSDSELIVRQISGQYKVRNQTLIGLYGEVMELLGSFDSWDVIHILRDKYTVADNLVNVALDRKCDVEEYPEDAKPAQKAKKPIRLCVLLSGGGTTLINILEYIKKGKLNAKVSVVISSRSTVAGVQRAKKAGLDVKIIRKKDFHDIDSFSNRIEEELVAAKVDLVIQAGWLCLWKIPEKYSNCVMNIHPALLPSFGGQGMWGQHVHEAVLAKGCKVSGCTVHFCTNEYDKGPILVQRTCPVKEDDTFESLAARVFEQECIAYPEAIKLFADRRVTLEKGRAKIKN